MKKRLFGFVGLLTLAALNASFVFAQDQTLRSVAGDKWVITAKAGGVNHVQGRVEVARKTGRNGILLKSDSIEVGDRVTTGEDGRAEILLNPGSYLRVAENSSFEFKTTSLEDLKILVSRGSVLLEVYAGNEFQVAISTPKEEYSLVQTGVYRIDVAADGNARLEVWKGKAEVDDAVVKGGKSVSTIDGQTAKFDRDERDEFEQWSRDRSKELAKGTNDLRDRTLRTELMRSFLGGRWNTYDSFGLWVYNPRFGRYCFLPFGFGWSSPYGFRFGSDLWYYRLPPVVFRPPTGGGGGAPPAGTGDGAGTPPATGGIRSRRPPVDGGPPSNRMGGRQRPAFVDMQGGPSTGRDFGGVSGASSEGGLTPGPTFRPGPMAAPPSSAPRVDTPSPPTNSGGIRSARGKQPD